jgi:hypothetical protein
MADKFVWSGATGADDGSKWEDAYVSLGRDWGAEAGFTAGTDFVYVRSSHNETASSADFTVTGNTAEGTEDIVRILSVAGNDTGTTPGALTTGATVNSNDTYDINIDEKIYIYGANFLSGEHLYVAGANTDHDVRLEKCRLELTSGNANNINVSHGSVVKAIQVLLKDTTIDFNNTSHTMFFYLGRIDIDGGSVLFAVSNFITGAISYQGIKTIKNFDLSILTGNLVNVAGADSELLFNFERCVLNSSATKVSGTINIPGQQINFHHCQSGTDSDPAYQMAQYTYQGTTEVDTARYRTDGASDDERTNPYSWSMDTSTGSNVIELYEPLESPPITGWTDGDASTAHTYRFYVASGATLQDDECWVDLIGPNDAATNSMGVRQTTRPDPLATPANLTTDSSSTWTGADVGTKQQIDITYTPDKPGPITARIYVAKPSERVSIDPKIYIDPS